ncbi:MAG: hypothetical protein ABIQ93_14755 [Saprospiraceae bacterium]
MKKSFLLLVFVSCTLLASAMNGPVKTFDPQKIGLDNPVVVPAPEANCIMCATCQNSTICFIASSCDKAGAGLTDLMIDLGCLSDH